LWNGWDHPLAATLNDIKAADVAKDATIHLVIPVHRSVPFLARGRQQPALAVYLKARFDSAKADLATTMVTRMRTLTTLGGALASVTPQNWLFVGSYKKLREALVTHASLALIAARSGRAASKQSAAK
jgi:hypothetical protein